MRSIRLNWTALLVAAIVVSFSGLANAADDKVNVAGTWEWTTQRQDQEQKHAIKLKQDGSKVTGVYVPPRGDEVELKDVKLEGNTISFAVTRTIQNQERTVKYNGKVEGDTIKGKSEMPPRQEGGEARARDWEAKKAKEAK
jgi:hypothetical protein